MKFIHVAGHRIMKSLLDAPLMVGGFYNWHRVFDGKLKQYREVKGTLQNYDVVFVSICGDEMNMSLCSNIREEIKGTDTKLVVTIDYGVAIWEKSFNTYHLAHELSQADHVFMSEPALQSWTRCVTNGKIDPVLLPHPSDVDKIKGFELPYDKRGDEVMTILHRYDKNWRPPHLVMHGVDVKYSVLVHTTDLSGMSGTDILYDEIYSSKSMPDYLKLVSGMKVVLDSYHYLNNYGRMQVEMACVGVPMVGTTCTHSQTVLWPDLTTEPNDVWAQRGMIEKLLSSRGFYRDCVEKAQAGVEAYGYEQSKQKFLAMIGVEDAESEIHGDSRAA